MKKISIALFITFGFCVMAPLYILAQSIDTTLATDYSTVTDWITAPPQWLTTAIIITGALLSATQTILKQIPTERSVRLGGIIGKILDVLTWFAKDNKKGGGQF